MPQWDSAQGSGRLPPKTETATSIDLEKAKRKKITRILISLSRDKAILLARATFTKIDPYLGYDSLERARTLQNGRTFTDPRRAKPISNKAHRFIEVKTPKIRNVIPQTHPNIFDTTG